MTRARSLSQLANSSVFTVATKNRVGIVIEVPTSKLDVDGNLNVKVRPLVVLRHMKM